MGIDAYRRMSRQAEDPKQREARVLSGITGQLAEHKDDGYFTAGLAHALDANTRFWNALADDLQSPSNQFPDALKGRLISLAIWVNRQSAEVSNDLTKVQGLIDVNKMIVDGLAASPVQNAESQNAAPQNAVALSSV